VRRPTNSKHNTTTAAGSIARSISRPPCLVSSSRCLLIIFCQTKQKPTGLAKNDIKGYHAQVRDARILYFMTWHGPLRGSHNSFTCPSAEEGTVG